LYIKAITNKSTSNKKLIVSYLFFICACIAGYTLPGTNTSLGAVIGFALSCLIFFYYFVMCGRTFQISKSLLLFFSYVVVSQLLLGVVQGEIVIIKNLFMAFISTFTVIVVYNIVTEEDFFKAYKVFGIICTIGLFYHVICVYILKQPVSPIIILPNAFVPDTNWAYNLYRPMSIFQEPAAYAGFMLPLLAYSIYKKEIMFSIIISISIIMSTSSIGILMTFGIWAYSIFFVVNSKLTKIGLVFVFFVILIFFVSNDLFAYSADKIMNINLENDLRLANGFLILGNMSGKDLLFGIGMGNITNYLNMHGLNYRNYISTISGTMINYGIIGFLFYCDMLFKFWKKQRHNVQLYVLIIIILSFAQTILFNMAFQYYFLSYFVCSYRDNRNYIRIRLR
jgi:hypothetical protein